MSLVGEDQGPLNAASGSELDYIHQRIGETDLYFLRNGSNRLSRHKLTFRVIEELPEVWDALTGEMHAASGAHLRPDGRAEISLELPPFASSILVFSRGIGNPDPPPIRTRHTQAVHTPKPWKITFQADRGAPEGAIETLDLTSWAEWNDPVIRYFSGTATYRATVTAPDAAAGDRVWLRFPDVREVAHVTINGKDAGTVWTKPLMLRVDEFLKPDGNLLEIEVTNLWPNRIIGDLQPDATGQYTSTNITSYKVTSPLLPSGLIGQPEWVIER